MPMPNSGFRDLKFRKQVLGEKLHCFAELIACIDAYIDAWMHRCMDAWMHGCMDACMHGCVDAWMHGCTDAWMHGCLDA